MRFRHIFISILIAAFLAPAYGQNTAGSSIASKTLLSSDGVRKVEQRVYDNGLGDIVQEITSYTGSTLPSIVVRHEYDEYRREIKTWLPVASSSGSGFVSGSSIANLARSQYNSDSAPFSRTDYDAFLPSLPSAQFKAGTKWQDNGKKVALTYSEYVGMGIYTYEDKGIDKVPNKKFLCTSSVDEDGCPTAEYTDLNGKLMISETSQGKTYYVYNVKGDLSYVIPPILSAYIVSHYGTGAGEVLDTDDMMQEYAYITYDSNGNPSRIYFTNGNVTKYVYSATGEKLRVTYQTAVPNISVAIGSSRELAPTEILSTDYTDYLLGGSLTLKNGRIDKYQFDEGYCQAEKYAYNSSQDVFTFCYYDQDHLGNIHQVTEVDGSKTGYVIQKINYYPFGAQFCDNSVDSNVQSHKYNGKEFDKMHGLNTYDYGARQYNPITARWDRMDPLCEKYYSVSPYAYCHDNPVNRVDPDGKDDYFNSAGSFMYSTSNGSDVYVNNVLITDVSLDNDASRQAVANVVGYYANEAGISYYVKGGKSVGDSPSGTVGLAYQSNKDTFAFTRGNDIYVNKSGGHINSYLHDKYNIISTFEHEKEHKNNGHGFGGMTNRAHASVYAKHIGSKTFSKTTKDYQNVVVNSFIEMLKKSITEGATDKVIMSLISDANKGLSGTGMQIVYRRTGSDTDSYNLEVVK